MAFPIASSIDSVRAIIEARVYAWWVTDQSKNAAYISWPSVDFSQPAGTEWLQVALNFGESFQRTFCATTSQNLRIGILTLTVFGAKAAGRATLNALAATGMAKFERQIVSGVEFSGVTGPTDISDPDFATAQVTVRFQFYETVTPAVV